MQSSGVIDLSDVNVELDQNETGSINMDLPDARTLAKRPVDDSSISMSDFYGSAYSTWANDRYPDPGMDSILAGGTMLYITSTNRYSGTNLGVLSTASGATPTLVNNLIDVFDDSNSSGTNTYWGQPTYNGNYSFGIRNLGWFQMGRKLFFRDDASISGFRLRYRIGKQCYHGGGCTSLGEMLTGGITLTTPAAPQNTYALASDIYTWDLRRLGQAPDPAPPNEWFKPGIDTVELFEYPGYNHTLSGGGCWAGSTHPGCNGANRTVTVAFDYILPQPILFNRSSNIGGVPQYLSASFEINDANDYWDFSRFQLLDVDFLTSGCQFTI